MITHLRQLGIYRIICVWYLPELCVTQMLAITLTCLNCKYPVQAKPLVKNSFFLIPLIITKLQRKENKQKKVQKIYSSTTYKSRSSKRTLIVFYQSDISSWIQDLQFFQNIFWYLIVRERKQSISRAILRAICNKVPFFIVPCFFLYNIVLDLTRRRKFAKLGDISSILACQIWNRSNRKQ